MFTFCDDRVKNSLYLGICFIVLFSSFNALANVQKTLTNSIKDDNPSYDADGYTSLGVLYTAFAVSMWTAPGIIAKIGPKSSMILATFFYGFYISFFYFENNAMTYAGAALCGIGASLLWTAQANYIVLNSEIGKVYKEIGIFWCLYQSSHFFGNLLVYWEFKNESERIDVHMRRRILTIFLALVLIAVVCLLCLKPPARMPGKTRSPLQEIWKSCKIVATKHMAILCITIATCGIHLTFLSVVSASMGFAQYLSNNSKKLAPLCGLLQGLGEVVGGLLSVFIGGKTVLKLKPILTVGCVGNILSYIIIILTLPDSSLYSYTQDLPLLVLPTWFLLAASVVVGIGDACLHTELYDHIGALYPDDSAAAFAVFKFFRTIATAGSFYYAKYMALHLQIVTLIVFSVLSFVTYHYLIYFTAKKDLTDNSNSTKETTPEKMESSVVNK